MIAISRRQPRDHAANLSFESINERPLERKNNPVRSFRSLRAGGASRRPPMTLPRMIIFRKRRGRGGAKGESPLPRSAQLSTTLNGFARTRQRGGVTFSR